MIGRRPSREPDEVEFEFELADEATREVDVDVVVEVDADIGQAEQRDGPDLLNPGQAGCGDRR